MRTFSFGTLPNNQEVTIFELSCGDVCVHVSNLGATLVSILMPDRSGSIADIVLGYDSAKAYYPNDPYYFGATVGPSANRVKGAEIDIDGTTYHMVINNGPNNLHTDALHGLHAQLWDATVDNEACAVTFTYSVADGTYGLPGNRSFTVRYALRTDASGGVRLRITHDATSDANTLINMTNHTYFNLAGEGTPSFGEQTLMIGASSYLPITDETVPTGEIVPVAGTPFDFRSAKPLAKDIAALDEQIGLAHGYDHCFAIGCFDDSPAGHRSPRFAARSVDPTSGRGLELAITQPGLQLYTGNFLGEDHGKVGHSYPEHSGFALEPEYFPAACAYPAFVQPIFGPNKPYHEEFEYRFFVA